MMKRTESGNPAGNTTDDFTQEDQVIALCAGQQPGRRWI